MFFFHRLGSFVFVLMTAISSSLILGCKEGVPNRISTPTAAADTASKPSGQDERLTSINKYEAKAAQGDRDAQLALAKILLDGKDATPNFARQKFYSNKQLKKEFPKQILDYFF